MSMIERKTSFQPTGRAGWPICLLPNWRGGAASVRNWWHKDALLACDFREGRFMRGGTELTAAYLFTTTRASGISLPDNADILQTLGINTLPRTDRGLFPNDQVTNSIRYSEDLTPANWTKDGVTISPLHYRYLTKIIESETNAFHGLRGSSSVSIAEGEVRRLSLDVKAAGRSVISIGAYSSFSVGTTLRVDLANGSFTGGTNAKVTPLGDGIFRIETSGVGTANGTAAIQIRIGDGPYMGDGVSGLLISRIQMNAGDYFPFYVPTPTNAIATTMASDIRAVQGVRPSDGQPEPFLGWEAAGLDDGFSVLMDLNCANIAPGATRSPVGLYTANNSRFIRMEIASGTFRARSSPAEGAAYVNMPGDIAGGRIRAAMRYAGGVLSATQAGAASVASASAIAPAPLTRLFVGNNATLAAPWNDWIYGLQICSPLSDTALLDWVNAA